MRINFKVFFAATGTFLVFVAAGILAYGVRAMESYGWLDWIPGHSQTAFNLAEATGYQHDSWYGSILAGILNFRPDPHLAAGGRLVLYVAIVLPIFLRRRFRRPNPADRPTHHPGGKPPPPRKEPQQCVTRKKLYHQGRRRRYRRRRTTGP